MDATFSRTWIFFSSGSFSSLIFSLLLFSALHLCFSSVHIVRSLISKLPSITRGFDRAHIKTFFFGTCGNHIEKDENMRHAPELGNCRLCGLPRHIASGTDLSWWRHSRYSSYPGSKICPNQLQQTSKPSRGCIEAPVKPSKRESTSTTHGIWNLRFGSKMHVYFSYLIKLCFVRDDLTCLRSCDFPKTFSKHWLGASKWSRWSIRQIRLPSLYPFEWICLPMWGGLRWKQCLRHWWREPSMVGETIVTPDRWSISCLPWLSALAARLCRLQLQLQSPSRGKGAALWIHRCQCGNLLCKIGSFAPLHAYPQHSIEEVSRQHSCKRPGTPPQKQWTKTCQTTAEGRAHCLRKNARVA